VGYTRKGGIFEEKEGGPEKKKKGKRRAKYYSGPRRGKDNELEKEKPAASEGKKRTRGRLHQGASRLLKRSFSRTL